MKVLITGAAGFIGTSLISRFQEMNVEVAGVDNFSDYYSVAYKNIRFKEKVNQVKISFTNLDLANLNDLQAFLDKEQPTTVIHLAAQAGVRIPLSENWRYAQSNLVGFSNLLQEVALREIPNFLYASSSSVYGNSNKFPFSESDDKLIPVSFYGATKLSNEIMTNSVIPGSNSKARGLRFFTVYGPWGRPDMAYFRMIAAILEGFNFKLNGDGTLKRDFTFISDIVESIILLASELEVQRPGFVDTVNIGGGKPHSMRDLIEAMENVSGTAMRLELKNSISSDVNQTIASTAYLQSLIGMTPHTTLVDGVQALYLWASREDIRSRLISWIE
jgi:UDP-glucuronate 4-epimerase